MQIDAINAVLNAIDLASEEIPQKLLFGCRRRTSDDDKTTKCQFDISELHSERRRRGSVLTFI